MTDHFRLIAWDLPGLGLSTRPDNNDYSRQTAHQHPFWETAPGLRTSCVGFDHLHIPPDHLGPAIMRERVAKIGAKLILTSAPGAGAQIVIHYDYPIG